MTERQVKDLQRDLNWFVATYNLDYGLLKVDGELGPTTKRQLRRAKYLLGLRRDHPVNDYFRWRLRHPKYVRKSRHAAKDLFHVRRGRRRRIRHIREARRNRYKARDHGVGEFDGKPVANWLIPYLRWARDNGWDGHLNSGWRDPAYSERLCFEICGAASCPGRCAGRASGHSQDDKPRGCIDVSDQAEFGDLMARCPLEPKLINRLGSRDPWHYSVTGT